jgi:anti-sigma regulatory factor (Ser/Thr protein kinase)
VLPAAVADGSVGVPRSCAVDAAAEPGAVAAARERIGRHAAACGASAELTADVVLCASELVANAVVHGCGAAIEVVGSVVEGDRYVLTVTQRCDGRPLPPADAWRLPDPAAPHGRGLAIVRALADEVGRVGAPGEATVVATFRMDR